MKTSKPWHEPALQMWRAGKPWGDISLELGVTQERIRSYIRKLPEYKAKKTAPQKSERPAQQGERIEYRHDGTLVSEKFITLRDGEEMTPELILSAHGMRIGEWEVVSYVNNFWNSQVTGGERQISYQSKLTVKPKKKLPSLEEIDAHFRELEREAFVPPPPIIRTDGLLAEVNICDLHLGKLCWHGETPENYDYKIARDVFFQAISDICARLSLERIEKIPFVWTHDFFNSDNENKTTTAGTPQDTDIREKKLFNVGVEMLVRGVEMLSKIAPVECFYVRSNHDETSGYHALKYLEAWCRQDPNVTVDTNAYPRKYKLFGNTLIGYTHGDKENSRGTHEKASRLASLMPIEAPELWSKSRFREMHAAHLHSEQMMAEINGVIVRRISSPTALDVWHTESGWVGAVRKTQTFLYDRELGNITTINTPVTAGRDFR